MDFNGLHLISVLLVCSLNKVSGHSCLRLYHVKDFDLTQFSGTWYAIQTTSPQSICLVYDFKIHKTENTKNGENINCSNCINCKNCVDCHFCEDCEDLVGCYNLKKSKRSVGVQNGNNVIDCSNSWNVINCINVHGCTNPNNCTNIRFYRNPINFRGDLPMKRQFVETLKFDPSSPSKLSVSSTQTDVPGKLPTVEALKADPSLPSKLPGSSTQTANVPEKTHFVVFTTDYQSYAGVYFCRKTANGPKHSVAILSRSQDLDKEKLDSLIEYVNYYYEGVQFSIVEHTELCNHFYKAYDANRSVQSVIGDDEKVDVHISFMSTEDNPEIP